MQSLNSLPTANDLRLPTSSDLNLYEEDEKGLPPRNVLPISAVNNLDLFPGTGIKDPNLEPLLRQPTPPPPSVPIEILADLNLLIPDRANIVKVGKEVTFQCTSNFTGK